MLQIVIYSGRDNMVALSLGLNGQPWSVAQASKIEIRGAPGAVNSVDSPGIFEIGSELGLRLGSLNWPAGTHMASLIVYSDAWPRGVVWIDRIKLIVHAA